MFDWIEFWFRAALFRARNYVPQAPLDVLRRWTQLDREEHMGLRERGSAMCWFIGKMHEHQM